MRKSAWMIAPSFVLPWLFMPLGILITRPGSAEPVLSGHPVVLVALGLWLSAYGAWTAWLILRDPESLAVTENHPSWTNMYRLMMMAQVGFALAYIF